MRSKVHRAFQVFLLVTLFQTYTAQIHAATWHLSWIDNSLNEMGFNIQRKTGASGSFSTIATTGPDVTSHVDSGLADNTMYCYRVNAFNSAGSSPYAPEVCATTPSAPAAVYNLTVSAQGTGTLTSNPSGINCGTTCTGSFPSGTTVTLLAAPASGYTFSGWSGDADCLDGSVSMGATKSCTAIFKIQTFDLSLTKAGTGSGSITSMPAGISCGSDCSERYNRGTIVALTATPTVGSVFAGWSGHADCSDGSVTMDANKGCTATFNASPSAYRLDVTLVKTMTGSGSGSGTVTSSPAGINCEADCFENYAIGTVVKLTATPATGSTFGGWTGDPDCSDGAVTLNANKTCKATFNPIATSVALSITKSGNGTVTSTPSGINCGADCAESYTVGTVITLNATPPIGSQFLGWSGGACSGTGNCVVTINANTSIRANFSQPVGVHRIGIFRPETGEWYLDVNGNGIWDGCEIDRCVSHLGEITDLPAVADWIGAGSDQLGVFRSRKMSKNARAGVWFLDVNNSGGVDNCNVDRCAPFGQQGDLPVVGDWTGSNKQGLGVFRPGTGKWYLDINGNGKFDDCKKDACLGPFGPSDDLPVAGDWTGSGRTRVGSFDPTTGTWHLDVNANGLFDGCGIDACVSFGQAGDLPVVGDWSGSGKAHVGLFRPDSGRWFLDLNGNGTWDGCGADVCLGPFGETGDVPVAGKW